MRSAGSVLVQHFAGDVAMNEEATVSQRWRTVLGVIGLLFCASIIILATVYGKADNTLHSSSLAWAWTGFLGILAGVGFGAIVQFIPALTATVKK
jgi:hypothetical protein